MNVVKEYYNTLTNIEGDTFSFTSYAHEISDGVFFCLINKGDKKVHKVFPLHFIAELTQTEV